MSYRLPTDLEWSRAVGLPEEEGTTPKERHRKNTVDYPWGTGFPPPQPRVGNYADSAYHAQFPKDKWIEGYTDGFATTAPVGSFPANQFGIHDLGGNVWEWCEDAFEPGSTRRVGRGASWVNFTLSPLSSSRMDSPPEARQRDALCPAGYFQCSSKNPASKMRPGHFASAGLLMSTMAQSGSFGVWSLLFSSANSRKVWPLFSTT
jgi:formylglycine-generating enzyme required for sulfatase activity